MKKLVLIGGLVVLGGLIVLCLPPDIQFSPEQESAAYLEVERGGGQSDPAETSVEFDDLSADQRTLFEAALERDRVEIPDDTDSSVWYEYDYVRYQNGTYSITVLEN